MAKQSSKPIEIYLEAGEKRTFAGAIDWPGWCRSGPNEEAALKALLENGLRYAHVLEGLVPAFHAPADASSLHVVERLEGNATTDFGAPGLAPALDARPVGEDELQTFQRFLQACWRAFTAAVETAKGKELRKGPRGGGRDLDDIARHVLESHEGYLRAAGWKPKSEEQAGLDQQIAQALQADQDALAASVRGEIAAVGPRGGARWSPRYFVRRVAWHILDHAWEIEDRIL